jgi:hypothetical protein
MPRACAGEALGWILVCSMVLAMLLPGSAEAQARAKKPPAKPASRAVLSGPVPPLPATTVTFTFEVNEADADLFTTGAAGAENEAQAASVGSWTIGDWRSQLHSDILQLESIRDGLAFKYDEMNQRSFPVAVRYLKGIHDAVAELMRLSWKARDDFDVAFPSDQLAEASSESPAEARRVRIYLDRARGLEIASRQFLARAVEAGSQRVERLPPEN